MSNKSIEKIKSSDSINGGIIDSIDFLLAELYKNVLISNYDIKNELLQTPEKIKFIQDAIKDFAGYDFGELQKDIKTMSQEGGKEIFKTAIDNVTKDLKSNVEKIIIDISNGNAETVKKIYGENVDSFETDVLKTLKNKLKNLETKVNAKIFPLIVSSLELLKNNDLEKLNKSLTLLNEINELEKKGENQTEKKEIFIKEYFPEEKFSEELFMKRKNILDKDFFENMKNINLISSMKEVFGDFLNSENIRLISTGKGQTILYKFIYKLISDILISNTLKMQTSTSYLLKNINKTNNYESNILNKINTIKSSGNIEKDYAVALLLNEIEEVLEIKDLSMTKKIQTTFFEVQGKVKKSITNIIGFTKEDSFKIVDERIKNNVELIEKSIEEYKNYFTKFNKVIEEKTEAILNIDNNFLNINNNLKNIDNLNIKNINDILNIINNYKENKEARENKIKIYKELIERSTEKIKYLNGKTPSNLEDIDLSLKEQNNENNLIKQLTEEIKKEESCIEKISDFLNKNNIDKLNSLVDSKEEYKEHIKNIKKEINEIKKISDFSEITSVTTSLKTKIENDVKTFKDIPNIIKKQTVDTRKKIVKFDDFKNMGESIKTIFNLSVERLSYRKSKDYLRIVSFTIKSYGFKNNLEEYFEEMGKVANKKLEIFHKLEKKIKSMQYLEKVLSKYPEEILRDNNKEKIKEQFNNILNSIEKDKLELLHFLTEKNNKSINDNMFDIDNELKYFLTKKNNSIKELQIMNIIKKGTSKSSPEINEKCKKILDEVSNNEKDVKKKSIISLKEGNLKDYIKLDLNFRNLPYFEYKFTKSSLSMPNFLKPINDDGYTDNKISYLSGDNVLRENFLLRFITTKDENNINKDVETLIKDKIIPIPTYDSDYKDFEIFKHINENNKININVLNYMEFELLKIIENQIKYDEIRKENDVSYISTEEDKKAIQEGTNIKYINIYFENLIVDFNDGKKNTQTNLLLEEVKKVTKGQIKEIILIEDKNELKKYLNNILNEAKNNLNNKNEPVNFVGNDFDISKTKDFNNFLNPIDFKSIENILNQDDVFIKNIPLENIKTIKEHFKNYFSESSNLKNKTKEEITTQIKNKLNNYLNKKFKENSQILINQNDDDLLNKIIDNNKTSNEATNEAVKKIFLIEDIISSKIKELNIKKELGKKTKLYSNIENECIENNINMLEILFKQMRKDFSHQFVKKEVLHYYETQEYISSINTKSSSELIKDLLDNQAKEEIYLETSDEQTMLINHLDVKQELNEILLSKDKRIKSFYSYFVKINDDINKLYLSNKDKNISILLFNDLLKNNNVEKDFLHKIENVNNEAEKIFPNYEIKDDISKQENKKENIKRKLISLLNEINNLNHKKLLEMLIKSVDYSEELYMNNLNKIKELSDLVKQESDYKIEQTKTNNLEIN